MSLVNYDSSTSESDIDNKDLSPPTKKSKQSLQRFQLPVSILKFSGTKNVTDDVVIDEPEKHDGRIRNFKHERGNWATYIYVPVNSSLLDEVQQQLQFAFKSLELQTTNDLHISLSRTVVLQYHLIDSFVKSLKTHFTNWSSFTVSLRDLKIYSNEEKTRTFIAYVVDSFYFEKLYHLLLKVDSVMEDYGLPIFYDDPSFHISFLWCLGDKVDVLNSNLKKILDILSQNNDSDILKIKINELKCKSGNKEFTFKLK
ncbi:U6 snRNA phosphodiesterase isoform X2 [Teleopsis dalmanni]|uniref:U6 snRNA phosphodiesterase isoform X2 n=1 Tax=Teleopsis dalmanni TaxID=139649 RepID=UPI0018CDFB8D|nr:U6 snRNA phosphodiesterase isoform X2 [Teleopsis dalmanni]XP_037950840.1 U6 snRNA phosphodiesterase isoform X2 [Teleopsis dalmanni]